MTSNPPSGASLPAPPDPADLDTAAFVDAHAESRKTYGRFNLGIIGGTGVGKSSLVNAVFGRDLARVGKGLPVTAGVDYYHDGALGIWDFEGFEIGSTKTPAEMLHENLQTIAKRPPEEQISVVWYCIASTAYRLTQPEIEMIRELHASGLPVILVLTKVEWSRNRITGKLSPSKDVAEFRDWLEHPVDHEGNPFYLPVQRVMLTSAVGRDGKGVGHGLSELVVETLALSPDSTKDAFRVAQRLNLPWKREMARSVIGAAAAAAAATAAIPFPVADATTLAPIQLTMMGRIAAIYELDLASMMSVSAIAQFSAQVAGQALARSFIKLIPGAGSMVNASVAGALTYATGEAWIKLCEQVHTGKIDLANVANAWGSFAPSVFNALTGFIQQKKS
ncbi:MAG: DUF697 domain-containing protein [Leucobacter sp.]|nr:DUF697 domain-containing protein [Leucobacter sp.]